MVYLNTLPPDDDGGSTNFPKLGLSVKPLANAALAFDNYHEASRAIGDPRCFHAGAPPKVGSKYALNVWVRTRPFF